MLQPVDAHGELVKLAGDVEIELFDMTQSAESQRWRLEVRLDEVREHWHKGLFSTGSSFRLAARPRFAAAGRCVRDSRTRALVRNSSGWATSPPVAHLTCVVGVESRPSASVIRACSVSSGRGGVLPVDLKEIAGAE